MVANNAVNANETGFQSYNTSTGVWHGRTLQQGTGITITNADGTAGDPTISAAAGSSGGSSLYGDLSDGSVTFDGSTVVLGITPSGNTYTLARDIFLDSSTINNGVTILTNGFRIFCNGTLTNNGTISQKGNDAVANVAGTALSNTNSSVNATGAGVSCLGTAGGGSGSAGTNAGSSGVSVAIGGAGGAGGLNSGGGSGGGASGGTIAFPLTAVHGNLRAAVQLITTRFYVNSANYVLFATGGAGGGGGQTGGTNGGAGGGGGGIVVLVVKLFAGTGTITAAGGLGGSPAAVGNTGAGGGGGGGAVLIVSRSIVSGAISGQTVTVAGGTGGTPSGTGRSGVNGSNGVAILVPDA